MHHQDFSVGGLLKNILIRQTNQVYESKTLTKLGCYYNHL